MIRGFTFHPLAAAGFAGVLCVGMGMVVRADQAGRIGQPAASAAPATTLAAADAGAALPQPHDLAAGDTAARALLDEYCVSCHNFEDWAGGVAFDVIDVAAIGSEPVIGEAMVRKLRAGVMPPYGEPRPDAQSMASLASHLEARLDLASEASPAAPPPGVHRLNRREYENAVYELLSLRVDASKLLPVDDSSHGFDNVANSLGTSPALVESYVSAAAKISRMALGHELEPRQSNYSAPADYSQDRHIEGLPFGTRGGLVTEHYFPADGEYVFNWAPIRDNAGGLFGNTTGEQVELSIDGERIHLYDFDAEVARRSFTDEHQVRVQVEAGLRTVGLAFVSLTDVPDDDFNAHYERTTLTQNVGGYIFSPHVNQLTIAGPFDGALPEQTASRERILTCTPATPAEEEPCAQAILSRLAERAYRGPLAADDLQPIMAVYRSGREAGGDFEDGVRVGLQMILSDPKFIFRTETVSAQNAQPGALYPVSDLELASRLSFFLWSSIPDEELLVLAGQGRLHDRDVLEQQVQRMLADPRSYELVRNFAGQWLQLRNLGSAAPVSTLYPDFDDNLRQAFRTEVELFFESILREDRSVVDLLDADYTFLNERLAAHYGVPNVYGSHFRRVELGPEFDYRRGLLGKGAILTVSSNADRTSTVRRGKWVDMNILGVIPPDPPPNVAGLDETTAAAHGPAPVTLRQRMLQHAQDPGCATCHHMMDPIGFAMERFDAIGRVRETEGGEPLDLNGYFVNGTTFEGPVELREQLMAFSPQFVQTMTERLLTYAIGRGVEHADMPVVRSIVRRAAEDDYRFSTIVMGVVESRPFLMNQNVEVAAATE